MFRIRNLLIAFSIVMSFQVLGETAEGSLPPAFTLNDLNGTPHTFDYTSTYKGKITILMFFSTWCSYCKEEIPYFQELYNLYKDNPKVAFLAVNTFRRDGVDEDEFVAQYNISYPVVNDTPKSAEVPSKVAKLYKARFVPFNLFYDKDGTRVPTPSFGNFEEFFTKTKELIDQLLEE